MAQETDNSADEIIDEVDNIFAISGLAISSLSLLFYPIEEIADTTETDLGFLSTVSKAITGLGLLGTLWSVGLLYTREFEVPPLIKWVLVPLVVLDVFLVGLLFAMFALETASVAKVGKFVLRYVKPVICTLGGVGLVVAMAVMPKKLLRMSMIGKAIHYIPAAFGYPPVNKLPFYVVIVLVRTGGLITALSGDIIDVVSANLNKKDDDSSENLQARLT